jgi:3-deoxy-manno-octulosonate cytidylyltransferase (CMP-KDO synthetase)
MKVVGIIPARYGSTRLPGKPLKELGGKLVIQRTYEQARQALDHVIVATDDKRVLEAVESFGGTAMMTRKEHSCGSERVAEVAAKLDVEIVVNIQGDEPFIEPAMIKAAVEPLLRDPDVDMATLSRPIYDKSLLEVPSIVKVVTDLHHNALFFSRSLIPYPRHREFCRWQEHVGLYVYRKRFLLAYVRWSPTPLEQAESLEQLRVLEHGHKIRVVETDLGRDAPCIDTPEDLVRARAYLEQQAHSGSDT